MPNPKPITLIILDGWGFRTMQHGNAVAQARTPNFDRWATMLERSMLDASGEAVGLTQDQMGNSEVGHLNLGAGFVVYQDIVRIDKAIREGTFFAEPTLIDAIEAAKTRGGKVHLVGLVSNGGVHSHTRHLLALVDFCKRHGVKPILHVITDGRDTPPNSGAGFVNELVKLVQYDAVIATVSGRYYAMDRDKRWERVQLAYDAIVRGQGRTAHSAAEAISNAYAANTTDEFILPTVIRGVEGKLGANDLVICFNFRADRMRQMCAAWVNADFAGFERPFVLRSDQVVTFTEYDDKLPVQVLFPPLYVNNPLAKVISDAGLQQFHAAETEKYPHVTFFFNGRREEPFPGESRFMAPSPKVATYDLQPEMSAHELLAGVLKRMSETDDDFILVNFANPDMVGHTGVLSAAIKAVETADECAGKLVEAINAKGGIALVTADHGNAEIMQDEVTGQPHTYHTINPVTLFVVDGVRYHRLIPRGALADVAPTVLHLLGLPQPAEMTGRSLIGTGEIKE
ncbi:MAG: 2,3-bisphosphoglycerate-independent phosphoglycerate mutase [Anaerolineae bacterium]|nr:2,3-bisphosphoglycerate-independent phosphoglycerate mutase [Anaerolineae bacterium]